MHSRAYIINTLFDDFEGKISDDEIEQALVRLNIITGVSKSWLKEHYIDKGLSALDCSVIAGCSIGNIQTYITKYKLQKKRFGLSKGNNKSRRDVAWKNKIAASQPNSKMVVVYLVGEDEPMCVYNSISKTAKKLELRREYVRDCLNPSKKRKSAKQYRFEYATEIPSSSHTSKIKDMHECIELEDKQEREMKMLTY